MSLKSRENSRKRDWVSVEAAKIHKVSARYVNAVRAGTEDNEEILLTVMDLIEGHNKLIQEVAKLVPIESNTTKRRPNKLGNLK